MGEWKDSPVPSPIYTYTSDSNLRIFLSLRRVKVRDDVLFVLAHNIGTFLCIFFYPSQIAIVFRILHIFDRLHKFRNSFENGKKTIHTYSTL